MKSRSRGWMRGPLSRGGSEARMPPRVVPRAAPREPEAAEPCGRAGVTVLDLVPLPAAERFTVPSERRVVVVERLMPADERFTSLDGLETLPVERLAPEDERLAELPERF